MTAAKPKVVIVGAGIGGLTAALSLLQRGFDVAVYEQAPQLGEIGAGFQVSANGARVLFELGLEAEIRAVCTEMDGKEIRLWSTGQTWKLFDLGATSVAKYGFPYFMIHRADLHGLLVEAVRKRAPDAIRLNARCTGVEQTCDGARVHFAGHDPVTADVVVGADGVHSVIRQNLFGQDKPSFTGYIAWRGLVPADELPEHLRRPVGTNWVGPGGHIVHYLLRSGQLFNFVGAAERDDWQVESWTERGSQEECAADFKGWHQDIQTVIRKLHQPFKWALLSREPMARWTEGRVTLLGDACHAALPFLAQGAVMAIEDGFILARCLEHFTGSVEAALAAYERLRMDRTAKVVLGSAANGKRFHNRAMSSAADAQHYVDTEWQEEKIAERYEWLFRYDAVNLPLE
ncbi:MAG TPA: FAD-dependent oxidoreductase [Stellaceae bacterium]|nr:FAD-dependent oxidoreductase [Stellaceae bacterium]